MNSTQANPIHIRDCIRELTERLAVAPGDCIVFPRRCDEEREAAKQRHPSNAQKD
jgi:hypothetical protein